MNNISIPDLKFIHCQSPSDLTDFVQHNPDANESRLHLRDRAHGCDSNSAERSIAKMAVGSARLDRAVVALSASVAEPAKH